MQKKKNKVSLTEAIAQSSAKGVVDMTGKSDRDMSGRGSHIPAPIQSGVPVTQAYQGVAHGLQGIPVTSVYRQALDKGVDPQEIAVAEAGPHPTHTGWVLRTVGSGGRAGRITNEVLVALANMNGDSDAQIFANVAIALTGPSSVTINSSGTFANTATFTVTPTLTGNTAAALSYQWQYNTGSAWANIPANTAAIHWVGSTTATLLAQPATTANNGTILRVVVTAADEGVVATSANATLSVPA